MSYIEEFAKGFLQVVDAITGSFGANTNFVSLITNRIGVTQISQQYYSITKVLYAVNGRQQAGYGNYIKASNIYNEYHKINEININGYKIYSDVPLRMNASEFLSLLDNNFAYINGLLCEILTIRYTDEQSKAVISYKEPFEYAQGKVEIIVINE